MTHIESLKHSRNSEVMLLMQYLKDYKTEIIPYLEVLAGEEEGDLEKLKETLFKPAVEKHYAFFTKLIKASGSGKLAKCLLLKSALDLYSLLDGRQ